MAHPQMNLPSWYDGKYINEVGFCEEFLSCRGLKFIGNTFYSVDGAVPIKDITELLHENYIGWCMVNGLIGLKIDSFSGWLKQNQDKYGFQIQRQCNRQSEPQGAWVSRNKIIKTDLKTDAQRARGVRS